MQKQGDYPQQQRKISENGKASPAKADTNVYTVLGEEFEIDSRYEIIEPLGFGAYGVVVAAKDTKKQDMKQGSASEEEAAENLVAIKKINRAFEQTTFACRTYRELKIQRLLNHENVLDLQTIMKPTSFEDFKDIYVVTDLMETDLAQIINDPTQDLSDEHIQFFLYQILRGLKYIHSADIYHRDLKPRNLLVNANCDLKICDFGLSRANIAELQNSQIALTDYISTRWYRAPEIIISQKQYTAAVDVWSVGCILAEMILRKPLLQGASEEEQFALVTDLLGSPPQSFIDLIHENKRGFVPDAQTRQKDNFSKIFDTATPELIDLLSKMLVWDPAERITIQDALEHPYLSQLHTPECEPTIEEPLSPFDFDFEKYQLTKDDYKELIYEEIELYHSHEKVCDYLNNKRFYPQGILHQKYAHRIRREYTS